MTNPVKNYRARTPNNQPNPIDVFIGGRIRYFRKLRHVSQVELAGSVGTTFQQVQKYENGNNRVSGSRLYPIDVFIGGRIRYFRKLRHVSQVELAGSVGTTFQQVQKYENGNNRVSGSRLWMISQVLQVPVSLFFEGINVKTGRSSVKIISGKEEAVYCPPDKFMPLQVQRKKP